MHTVFISIITHFVGQGHCVLRYIYRVTFVFSFSFVLYSELIALSGAQTLCFLFEKSYEALVVEK